MKEVLSRTVETLYQSAPECFCERLVPDTFHVTLHDLGNSPVLRDVADEVFENELNVIRQKQTGAIHSNHFFKSAVSISIHILAS